MNSSATPHVLDLIGISLVDKISRMHNSSQSACSTRQFSLALSPFLVTCRCALTATEGRYCMYFCYHNLPEKVAVAMHCNLRPPDVTPVVLGFNHEVHNAQPSNSTIAQPPWTHNTPIHTPHTPNFNAIEQSAAELQRCNYLQSERRPPSLI